MITAVASAIVFVALFLPWFGYGAFGVGASFSGLKIHTFLVFAFLTSLLLVGYLLARAGWDRLPVEPPSTHHGRLLVLTGVQLLLVLGGFIAAPASASRQFGAGLALVAALAALLPVAIPVVRAWQARQG